MFCPQCGQQRLSTETSFCSRCGFLLTGTAELLSNGGLIPRPDASARRNGPSERSRGIRQGAFIILTSLLIVPILTLITILFQAQTPILPIFATILLVGSGMLRIAYSAMFLSGETGTSRTPDESPLAFTRSHDQLPASQSIPASVYAAPAPGGWRTTNELEPHSVTDSTTKLLEKEEAS